MYEKFFEQAESVMKPLDRMFAINMQTLDDWREKQTAFLNDLMERGVNYSRDLPEKRDFQSLLNWQQAYWESLQEKFNENARESFALLSEAQEKLIGLYEDSLVNASDFAERATAEARSNVGKASKEVAEGAKKAKRTANNQAKKVMAELKNEGVPEPEPTPQG